MEEKRPRARHRFGFSGKPERNKQTETTTDQILISMNRQARPTGNVGEDQEHEEEPVRIVESEQPGEYSKGRSAAQWVFFGMLSVVVVALWVFGLLPRILYVDTVGSVGNLVSMVPSIDLMIIVVIWMVALVIGLLGRRARHVSKTNLSGQS